MAREIHIVSSMATRAWLTELVDRWQAEGGAPLRLESVGGVDAARRVAAGEPFDVVLLAADAVDTLAAAGHVADPVDVVRCGVAVAAPAGGPHPSIADEAALRAAVEGARRVAYSTGPSGKALQTLFERWGIAGMMRGRSVQAPPGVPVGALIAQGAADLGFQQLSELVGVPGIDVLGPMPPGLEVITTFRAARGCAADGSVDVQPLLTFLRSRSTDDAKRRHGMLPVSG